MSGLGWASVSELARLRGVDKAAISRRVKRMVEQGLLATRAGKGGTKLVNIAEFDRAAAEATDAVREMNGRSAAPAGAPQRNLADPVLSHEQARRVSYEADLKRLVLEERLGHIVPVDRVRNATVEFAAALARVIDALPRRAEEIHAAGVKDGVTGTRAALKAAARELRDEAAKAMAAIADAAELDEEAELEIVEAEEVQLEA